MTDCIIIPALIDKTEEPLCDHCMKEYAHMIAQRLGKEEEQKASSYPKPPPSEVETLQARNEILESRSAYLEQHARDLARQFDDYRSDTEQYKKLTESRFQKLTDLLLAIAK